MIKYILPLIVTISCYAKTVVWFTGLPCSGKTTISKEFHTLFPNSVMLDGDAIRKTMNSDLGFSMEDRKENIRRVTEMTKLCLESVDVVLVSCVSPSKEVRASSREAIEALGATFLEVYVNCPVDECVRRDVKGHYKRALAGGIKNFTGISHGYDVPENPEVICMTEEESVETSVQKVIDAVGYIHPREPHALFIGRWSPFHQGHFAIMKEVIAENPERPVMVFVREREGEHWSAQFRKGMVEASLKTMNVRATVKIIPDIESVNWGRGVGYTPRMIDLDSDIVAISGTNIRKSLAEGTDEWKNWVCPGVAEFIDSHVDSK